MKKRIQWTVVMLSAALLWGLAGPSSVCYAEENQETETVSEPAADGTEQLNTVMRLTEATGALAEPKTGAEVVAELKEGEDVIVTKKMNDGWYQIIYAEKTAFVPSTKLTESPVDEALVKEMQEMAKNEKVQIEAFERQRKESVRAKIWGAVIAVLIIGIFALGLVSTLKASKEAELKKKKEDKLDVTELDSEKDKKSE